MKTASDLLADLDKTISICRGIECDIHRGRIETMRDVILRQAECIDGSAPTYEDFQTALIESHDITAIQTIPVRALMAARHRLKRIHEGDFDYARAGPDDPGRNAGFEFGVAAYFTKMGADVRFKSPSDVVADLPNYRLGVECKRVSSLAGIGSQYVVATRQIAGHRRSGFTHAFAVAIDVTRVLNPNGFVQHASSLEEANRLIHQKLEVSLAEARVELERARQNVHLDGIAEAVFLRVLTLVESQNPAGIFISQNWAAFPSAPNGHDRYMALRTAMANAPGLVQ